MLNIKELLVKQNTKTRYPFRRSRGAVFIYLLGLSILFDLYPHSSEADGEPVDPQTLNGCERLLTPDDVVGCALSYHPEAQRAKLANLQAEKLKDIASQRPNPELGGKSVFGNSLGDYVVSHEINLAVPLELGGKRGSRIERALAEQDSVAANAQRSREEVLVDTIRHLYRLRQIQAELDTINEALSTFAKIQRQFLSRPRRTPEQEVSLSVFGLAEGDYKLRKAALETENATIKRSLELAVGREFQPSSGLLPPKQTNWPKLQADLAPTSFTGSSIKSAKAGLKLAEAELSVAQSLSWPTLRVGPSIQSQTQGPFTYQAYGLNLSFELPIFQFNGGGRAYAERGLEFAEKSLSIREKEIFTQRGILLQKYANSVKAIQNTLSGTEVERKHQSAEALFLRGIIPSSLVIEAHRQIVEFTKSQNEQELSAIEAMWGVYILEGRAFGEKL
jgi:cobalt-zinc-cadmium efflux system outer membrane protein